jgi:phage tail-like protein
MANAGVGTNQDYDVLTATRFELQIDGFSMAQFSELSGISSTVEVVDYLASNDKELSLKKLPGKRNPPTITLKRGMCKNVELNAWHELVVLGDVAGARKSCSLTMYNTKGDPVAKYNLTEAWPSKIEVGALKAGASEVLFETVTIVCEFIQRVSM